MTKIDDETALAAVVRVMATLRDPAGGCPWDREQTFATIAPYTIEEAYEVADAIARDDMAALKDELGDLLFQVAFHARMAEERGAFDFRSVARGLVDKMVRRHPHVFGDATVATADAQTAAWEVHKAAERSREAHAEGRTPSLLDGVALGFPALLRAHKLQARAARGGFDWPEATQVLAKIDEELGELRTEIADGADRDRIEDEIGDLLFACVNLARHLNIDSEGALRRTNAKFERRFRAVESGLAAHGKTPSEATLDEMEELWVAAKLRERRGSNHRDTEAQSSVKKLDRGLIWVRTSRAAR
jgi:MazG family protein